MAKCTSYKSPHDKYLQPLVTSSPLNVNIPLKNLFLNSIKMCSFLSVRDKRHPYKTTGNTIVLYILILTSLYRINKVKIFWYESTNLNLLLISSWFQFLFVTLFLRYLNFSTFSKDILTVIKVWSCTAPWWRVMNIYLAFFAVTSVPNSLLASNRPSAGN